MFLSKYTYFGVKNIGDPQAFKEANKKNMCLVLPDKGGGPSTTGIMGLSRWGAKLLRCVFRKRRVTRN